MSSRETLKNSWRKAQRVVKNQYNSYDDAQVSIRNATSNSSSIPSREQLAAVARYCDTNYDAIAPVLWRRLVDYKFRRHVLKALIVTDYLLLRAGEQFMADVVERIDIIRRLKMFKFFKNGVELGHEVREQAAKVMGQLENFDDLTAQRIHLKETGRRLEAPETGFLFEEEGARLALGAPPQAAPPLRLEYSYDNFGQSREEVKYDYGLPPTANEAFSPEAQREPSADEDERAQHEEDDEEAEKQKPKKKKGKNLKKKRAKKPVAVDDEEGDELVAPAAAQKTQSTLDDFLLDLMAPAAPAAKSEQALAPALSNQLGWLGSSTTAPVTDNELALFDIAPVAPAPPARAKSIQESTLFDFTAPAAPVAAPMHYHHQPYGAPASYGYAPQYHPAPVAAPSANQAQWNMSQQLALEYHPQPAQKQDDVFSWMK